MPDKSSAKRGKKDVKKTASKSTKKPAAKKPAKRSSRTPIDKSMAIVLEATGLGQLRPIRPSRKTRLRSKDKPTSH